MRNRLGRGWYALVAGLGAAGIGLSVVGGQRMGLYETPAGIGIMTLGITALSLVALVSMSRALKPDTAFRRKSEAAMRSEALLRALLDSTSDTIYVKDRQGRFLLMNKAGAAGLGMRPEEIVGKTAANFFPEETARMFRFHELSVLQSGAAFTFEDCFALPGRASGTYLTVVSPFKLDDHVAGVVGISRDITGRKENEAAILASEAKYRSLLEAAPDAVFVLDRQGRIVLANSQAETMFGFPRQDLLGHSIAMLVPKVGRAPGLERWSAVLSEPGPRRLGTGSDRKGRRRDGAVIDIEVSLSPAGTEDGGLVTAIVRDATERNRIQAEMARHSAEVQAAREAARLKDVFLSSMSHEMKTPLSMILGYAELLEDKHPEDPLIVGVLAGTRRLIDHVESLLTYSALLSGALPLYKTDTCLTEVLHDAASIVMPAIEERGQRLVCTLDPKAPSLEADPRRLCQIVQALLDNASRFSPPGSAMELRVNGRKGHVEVSVRDSGVGMSEAELARIWEPFGQAKVSDTERTGGLGLGLKIARKLVELHGGTISILSKPGQGFPPLSAPPALRVRALSPPPAGTVTVVPCAGSDPPRGRFRRVNKHLT